MTFRGKQWERNGNRYHLIGTQIDVYQWNSGKNANFLVTAGYRNSNHKERSFPKGDGAKEAAINYALFLSKESKYENDSCQKKKCLTTNWTILISNRKIN